MSKIGWAGAIILAGAAGEAVEGDRFLISSYGYALPNKVEHRSGAFIIDTESGDISRAITGCGTQKVGALPR